MCVNVLLFSDAFQDGGDKMEKKGRERRNRKMKTVAEVSKK